MKYVSKILFLVALFALSFVFANAQETGGVKGKVRNTRGDGIGGATVSARQKGEDVKSVSADEKGNFVLDGLQAGIYNVVFSKNGFSSGTLYNIEIKKKKTSDLGDRLILTTDEGTQIIIKGSVFSAEGRSVGGAEIKIEQISGDGAAKKVGSAIANYSGEFTFRFSEGAKKYRITASMKGATASKEVEVGSAAIYRLALTLNSSK